MATAQPGNSRKLAPGSGEIRLLYPVDPASLDSCSIGGNVGECAGGASASIWGNENYVCGMEAVLADRRNFVFGR